MINEHLEIIEHSKNILDNSENKLTLRALFYKLVSKNLLLNNKNNYTKLSRIINNARWKNLLPFDCIEDRIRTNIFPTFYEDVEDLIQTAIQSYETDIWEKQNNYIEILAEKDTLITLFEPIARKYKINLSVCKGYNSLTEIYKLSERFKDKNNKTHYILYIGDLDPSGLDMDRDIKSRLEKLNTYPTFIRVALNINDVKKYSLLPNRIKKQDPRAKKYPYTDCWEIDALDPTTLQMILVSRIKELIDSKQWEIDKKIELENKNKIRKRFSK